MKPVFVIQHRQRNIRYDRERVDALVQAALSRCVREAQKRNAPLASLEEISITVIGPRAMAKTHRDFLQICGATDVITFPYGEILICAAVAADRAAEFGHSTTDEIALYAIHGLLHLAGFDDIQPEDARKMAIKQERVLREAIGLADRKGAC